MDDKVINGKRRDFLGTSAVAMCGISMAGAGLLAANQALAQPNTPKGLAVIGYPDTKGVKVERVSYVSRNTQTKIAANLFTPANFDPSKKYAAIVVTHPIGGVKEQTAGLYALKLAELGFVALAYDASYQGDSGGEPRLMELPAARVDDISGSIDFLSTLPQVDADRIGSLGICGGGVCVKCRPDGTTNQGGGHCQCRRHRRIAEGRPRQFPHLRRTHKAFAGRVGTKDPRGTR